MEAFPKKKVNTQKLPTSFGTHKQEANKVKYVGVKFDCKLTWINLLKISLQSEEKRPEV